MIYVIKTSISNATSTTRNWFSSNSLAAAQRNFFEHSVNVFDLEVRIPLNDCAIPICLGYSICAEYKVISATSVDEEGDYLLNCFFLNVVNYYNKNPAEFLSSTVIYYVHNLNFDGRFILSFLVSKQYEFTVKNVNNRIQCITVVFKLLIIKFRCSYLMTTMSLNKFCALFTVEGAKSVFPYKLLRSAVNLYGYKHPQLTHEDFKNHAEYEMFIQQRGLLAGVCYDVVSNLEMYCQNDLLILKAALINFLSLLSLAPLEPFDGHNTAIEFSLACFFQQDTVFCTQVKERFKAYVSDAEYPPRSEVFGNLDAGELGITMDFGDFIPELLEELLPAADYETSFPAQVQDPGFYTIAFINETPDGPALPVKLQGECGTFAYPEGIYSGTYWYKEILLFIQQGGTVLQVDCALVCKELCKAPNGFSKFLKEVAKSDIPGASALPALIYSWLISGLKKKAVQKRLVISRRSMDLTNVYKAVQLTENYINYVFYENTKQPSNMLVGLALEAYLRMYKSRVLMHIQDRDGRALLVDGTRVVWAFKAIDKVKWVTLEPRGLSTIAIFGTNKGFVLLSTFFRTPLFYMMIYGNSESPKYTIVLKSNNYDGGNGYVQSIHVTQTRDEYDRLVVLFNSTQVYRYQYDQFTFYDSPNRVTITKTAMYVKLATKPNRPFIDGSDWVFTQQIAKGCAYCEPAQAFIFEDWK